MPFSAYLDNKVIDHVLGSGTYSKPAALYVALFNGNPASGGTEISTSGSGYARQSAAFTISANSATNTANIEFPVATSAWGSITHIAIYDASTSGNQLVTSQLTTSKTIGIGDVLRIPASNLNVTLT